MSVRDYKVTLDEYYQLEAYRFNLALFTLSPEFAQIQTNKSDDILQELQRLLIFSEVAGKILIPYLREGKQIMVWTEDDENPLGFKFLFEFPSVSVASKVLDISEYKITANCSNMKFDYLGNYRMCYKENFNFRIRDVKPQ